MSKSTFSESGCNRFLKFECNMRDFYVVLVFFFFKYIFYLWQFLNWKNVFNVLRILCQSDHHRSFMRNLLMNMNLGSDNNPDFSLCQPIRSRRRIMLPIIIILLAGIVSAFVKHVVDVFFFILRVTLNIPTRWHRGFCLYTENTRLGINFGIFFFL